MESIAPEPSTTRAPTLILLASAAALLLAMWVTQQGDFLPVVPARFAASLFLIAESIPALAAFWLGAAGLGYPFRRWLLPTRTVVWPVAQVGLGLAAMMLLIWLLAQLGGLNVWSGWGLCAIGIALLALQILEAHRHAPTPPQLIAGAVPWTLPLLMPGLGMMLIAATCPPGTLWRVEAFGYDVTSYHLQLPREWLELGAMRGLEHNVYSYLPGLMEGSFLFFGILRGGMLEAVYTCQLFHASLAFFTAIALSAVASIFVPWASAMLAGAVFLSVPWTIILGSMAYNEMATLAFGTTALLLAFDSRSETLRLSAWIGLLAAAATLAKPTAGPMIAVPIGLILLSRFNHALRWRKPPSWPISLRSTAMVVAVGLITLSPYLIRNYQQTGNPLFPAAMNQLGSGHFDAEQVERWDRAHHRSATTDTPMVALFRQWLANSGYGAVGGYETPIERENIARFQYEWGIPVLWIAVLLMTATALSQQATRRVALAMAGFLALQISFWLLATHWQSRFLIPTLMPASLLVALGIGSLATRLGLLARLGAWGTALLVPIALVSVSLAVLGHQTRPLATGTDGRMEPGELFELVDTLEAVSRHPINDLPRGTQTLLVADAGALLYIDRPFTYNTAFDRDHLGSVVDRVGTDPSAIARALRSEGFTHVWISLAEADRLRSTYGLHASLSDALLQDLTRDWPRVGGGPRAGLFALPR